MKVSTTIHLNSLAPLPLQRPLLLIGHGTRDEAGRQTFIDEGSGYDTIETCFIGITHPRLEEGSAAPALTSLSGLSSFPISYLPGC